MPTYIYDRKIISKLMKKLRLHMNKILGESRGDSTKKKLMKQMALWITIQIHSTGHKSKTYLFLIYFIQLKNFHTTKKQLAKWRESPQMKENIFTFLCDNKLMLKIHKVIHKQQQNNKANTPFEKYAINTHIMWIEQEEFLFLKNKNS